MTTHTTATWYFDIPKGNLVDADIEAIFSRNFGKNIKCKYAVYQLFLKFDVVHYRGRFCMSQRFSASVLGELFAHVPTMNYEHTQYHRKTKCFFTLPTPDIKVFHVRDFKFWAGETQTMNIIRQGELRCPGVPDKNDIPFEVRNPLTSAPTIAETVKSSASVIKTSSLTSPILEEIAKQEKADIPLPPIPWQQEIIHQCQQSQGEEINIVLIGMNVLKTTAIIRYLTHQGLASNIRFTDDLTVIDNVRCCSVSSIYLMNISGSITTRHYLNALMELKTGMFPADEANNPLSAPEEPPAVFVFMRSYPTSGLPEDVPHKLWKISGDNHLIEYAVDLESSSSAITKPAPVGVKVSKENMDEASDATSFIFSDESGEVNSTTSHVDLTESATKKSKPKPKPKPMSKPKPQVNQNEEDESKPKVALRKKKDPPLANVIPAGTYAKPIRPTTIIGQ